MGPTEDRPSAAYTPALKSTQTSHRTELSCSGQQRSRTIVPGSQIPHFLTKSGTRLGSASTVSLTRQCLNADRNCHTEAPREDPEASTTSSGSLPPHLGTSPRARTHHPGAAPEGRGRAVSQLPQGSLAHKEPQSPSQMPHRAEESTREAGHSTGKA